MLVFLRHEDEQPVVFVGEAGDVEVVVGPREESNAVIIEVH